MKTTNTKGLQIKVKGLASKKIIWNSQLTSKQVQLNILNYLKLQNIPLASSCFGEGICKKCIVNKDVLACKTTLKEISTHQECIEITVSYL